ncbi:MAG: flagellar hook-basal body complex protein FliE [Candidatus Gastranaerophilales bacterium]|nr:flagellar hook-basal body complex protein FliE [Candidatus Gastranaerophilales bacterium]
MDFIGGIEGMKFTPISNYNSYLENNKAFDVDGGNEFENILNQTMSTQNAQTVQGGVSVNNFDELMNQANIQATQTAVDSTSTGNFINSFSNSINGGLNSVNKNIQAADKAQEALAMGEDISVHDVMIAAEKASLSLSMAMQLRNKLLSAYSEINSVKV